MDYEVGDVIEFNSHVVWFYGIVMNTYQNEFIVKLLTNYIIKNEPAYTHRKKPGDTIILYYRHCNYVKKISSNNKTVKVLFGEL